MIEKQRRDASRSIRHVIDTFVEKIIAELPYKWSGEIRG